MNASLAAAQTTSLLKVSVATPEAFEGVRRRLQAVKPATRQESGRVVIALRLPESGREVEIALPEPTACTPAMRGALKAVEGVSEVELV